MDYTRLEKILNRCNGNISEAARRMGEPRETVRYHVFKLREQKEQEQEDEGMVPLGTGKTVDLVISDTQFPFQHPDTFAFLAAMKEHYRPTRVLHVGDLVDSLGFSFHERDPESPSITEEMSAVEATVEELSALFPEMYVVYGNHDMRIYRKAAAAGIPRRYIKSINELIGAPDGWKWRNKWTVPFSNGEDAVMIHNVGCKDAIKGAQLYGKSIIQGHYASVSEVKFLSNRDKLMWGMTVGCSIDDSAIAFEYNKLDIKRPIISHAVIVNGVPHIVPMKLDKRGRWIGELIA